MEGTAGEEWKSPDTGAEKDYEGSWAGSGKLACGEEFSRHHGSSQPDVPEKGGQEAKSTDHIKEPVMRGDQAWQGGLILPHLESG